MEDKNYKYTNCNWMYTKWKKYVFSMHPAIINKITDLDLKEIKKNKALFIRKVTNNFDFIPIKYNKMLCIITIGTETNQKNVDVFMKENKYNCDFIIFSFINDIVGSYRPAGGSNLVLVSGQLNDGCVQCPRGIINK